MDASAMLGIPETPLLTVEEAAGVLRIGRSLAYQLAREYDATGGVSGLPVIRLGGCLRVPRWVLLELALTGRACASVTPSFRSRSRLMSTERRIVLTAGTVELRRRLDPTAWLVFEQLLFES